jgi:two-component system heavy metal sensor histidine kinase CusS
LITLSSVVTETEWRVSVADEGPGVPADQCARIFERFVKLETRPDEKKGSGLGLAICRSILTLHRGRIYAELRDIGKGLQVTFEIPVT